MQQEQTNWCEQAGPSGNTPPQFFEGAYSSLPFTELLTHSTRTFMEVHNENKWEGVESQKPNLDLSLSPSRVSLETEANGANCLSQQSPFHGFRHLCKGVPSSPNFNPYRFPTEPKDQHQQYAEMMIVYGNAENVYNVSADLAKVIMALASSGEDSTSVSTACTSTATSFGLPTPFHSTANTKEMCSSPPSTGHAPQTWPALPLKPIDVQLTRQNSLQRFLEKRKSRLHSKAPYGGLR